VVENAAAPLTRVLEPIVVAPFLNVTLPVGNVPEEETNAVNVTDCP
jgi:hypothetical protein